MNQNIINVFNIYLKTHQEDIKQVVFKLGFFKGGCNKNLGIMYIFNILEEI